MGSYTQLSFTEQVKRCAACHEVKPRTEFYSDRHASDRLGRLCKDCAKAARREWYVHNKEYAREWGKAYRERPGIRERKAEQLRRWKAENADHYKRQRREYYLANREDILRKDKEYVRRNADRVRERQRRWNEANREHVSERNRANYRANREQRLAHDKAYREANRDEIRRRRRELYLANRESRLEAMREWREKPENRERMRANSRQWREANRERFIAHVRNRKIRIKNATGELDRETVAFFGEVRRDPCSYCGKPGGTLDHIVPIARGGRHHWSNFAGACLECNMRKKTMSALTFLYRSNRRSGG